MHESYANTHFQDKLQSVWARVSGHGKSSRTLHAEHQLTFGVWGVMASHGDQSAKRAEQKHVEPQEDTHYPSHLNTFGLGL